MNVLLYIAMFLCFLSIIMKVSLLEWWKGLLLGFLLLGFSLLMVPYTAQSNRMLIEGFMADREARQIVAIIATLESALTFGYAFRNWQGSEVNPQRATALQLLRPKILRPFWWMQKHYISLLIFPTLFFIQSQVLYALPGYSFYIPFFIVGGAVLVLVPLLAWLFREAFPEREHREESLLLISLALSILVLISTNYEEIQFTRSTEVTQPQIWDLLMTLGLFMLFIMIGFFLKRLRRNRANK